MEVGLAEQLEEALDLLLLRPNRDGLCKPVIAVAPAGVDRQTYPILTTLARLGPMSSVHLAEVVGIDRSGVSRFASRLQDVGLLERRTDPDDQRVALLCLTPEGEQTATDLHAVLADHLRALISTWPPGRAEALVEGIRHLIT